MNMIPTCASVEDVISSVEAMRRQEQETYHCEDYLYTSSRGAPSRGPLAADVECRTKMAEWCYQVVDFCRFNRETVGIAMDMLDRYLMASPAAIEDRKIFQLAAMTCLYTAVKVHEPEAMEPKTISGLSRGAYTVEQVEEMERQILVAIKWRVNPPTALSFVHHFLALTQVDASELMDMAKFQTELAVSEYALAGIPKSTIALCALANAGLPNTDLQRISQVAQIAIDANVIRTQETLYNAMNSNATVVQAQPATTEIVGEHKTTQAHSSGRTKGSPRCAADY
eukprot:CAMPEP_0194026086 /NCGR_PEP_ID=MMETSP0009_2-20130614/393_1 /TAXON_ID=210454 /ORGANISM="Grammatophora oceanica, Strain CCMP 410" /LENGTH=282 /DNA_ID=CAMNT_0038664593 /DNA_START=78 /DNA_END=926 /DNA_ORIENTATION=-